eukprot:1130276-Pyramimonas_sp.AAC.1
MLRVWARLLKVGPFVTLGLLCASRGHPRPQGSAFHGPTCSGACRRASASLQGEALSGAPRFLSSDLCAMASSASGDRGA